MKSGTDNLNSIIQGTKLEDLKDDDFFSALAATDFEFYCRYTHKGTWEPYPHLKPITNALQRIAERKLTRLMIFLPPRHGKSMTISETFPSYFVGRYPQYHAIVVSYGDVLAQRFGRRNRQKIEEFGKQIFQVSIAQDQGSKVEWELSEYRGGVTSVGIGGAITGRGAQLLIIDDPIKNREEANSLVYRNKVWDEWQYTLRTRLEGQKAAVIIVTTRWHHDDLVGRLMNPDYGEIENWEIISLPAIAEEGDMLNRTIGQPLAPDLGYDLKWAEATKIAVGSYAWQALYQQRPSEKEGAIFKRDWWRFYQSLPDKFDKIIQSWDMAFKDTQGSSFVVGQIWSLRKPNIYLLDQVRDHLDFTKTLKAVASLTSMWPRTQSQGIYIEEKANGVAVMNVLKEKIPGLIPVTPTESKISRAYAVTPLIEAGNVLLPDVPWVRDIYLPEMSAFPTGEHNDIVDATTQALMQLAPILEQSSEGYDVLKGAVMYG